MPRGVRGSGKAAVAAREAAAQAAPGATLETPATPAATTDTPIIKRRGRRKALPKVAAPASETMQLVEKVLRSRGTRGATQETLQSVVTWARSIREEGESLQQLSSSPRRRTSPAPTERVARYEMNLALLEGVLAGTLSLDVQDNGDFVFLHGAIVSPTSITEVEDTSGQMPPLENVTGDISG